MRRWKLLLAGAPGAGKSTLCRTLLNKDHPVRKTQSPEYHGDMAVDLPGEFLTVPRLRLAFLASAQEARLVLYLQAANEIPPSIPAGLLQTVPGLILAGVISKADHPEADVERSRRHFRLLGLPEPYFAVNCLTRAGIAPLRRWLAVHLPDFAPFYEEDQNETNACHR